MSSTRLVEVFMQRCCFIAALALIVAGSPAWAQDHVHPAAPGQSMPAHSMNNKDLPPDEAHAKERLNTSPRHGEWVRIKAGDADVNSWIVYPERRTKAPVVIVIQEIFGLTDWIRGVTDQLAAEGFIAIAPDLLSGHGPNGGGTEAYPGRDEVTRAVSALAREEVNTRLDAVRAYGLRLPAASGRSATVGFCWGGSSSFAYAVVQPALDAAVVYYGTAPTDAGAAQGAFAPAASLANTKAAVLGLYGGADARIGATVPATRATMKELNKVYEVQTFDGAGHGFLRDQMGQSGANMQATDLAWPRTIAFLRKYAEGTKSQRR
jgi:carboxymethylenebutenolidase